MGVVTEQHSGVPSVLLPYMGLKGQIRVFQTWWYVPLPNEPSQHPQMQYFNSVEPACGARLVDTFLGMVYWRYLLRTWKTQLQGFLEIKMDSGLGRSAVMVKWYRF